SAIECEILQGPSAAPVWRWYHGPLIDSRFRALLYVHRPTPSQPVEPKYPIRLPYFQRNPRLSCRRPPPIVNFSDVRRPLGSGVGVLGPAAARLLIPPPRSHSGPRGSQAGRECHNVWHPAPRRASLTHVAGPYEATTSLPCPP